MARSWLLDGRILRAGLEEVRIAVCGSGLRRGLTDLNAGCRSRRAVGLSQRRGLRSHVQSNEAGMYGAGGRRTEGRGEDGVRRMR